jgi:hypothetical protein
METFNITIHPNDISQVQAIKAMIKAFKIDFKIKKETYNPEFVEKIRKSEEQYKKGKFTRVNANDLEKYLNDL